MIDGFASVQAVRRARTPRGPASRPSEPVASSSKPVSARKVGEARARIGHTAIPHRFDITCYACGYGFVIQGQLGKIFCPKCREQLNSADQTIEGEWQGDLQTIGTVHVSPGAVLKGGFITARQFVLAGTVEGTRITVHGCMNLREGGQLSDGHQCTMNDLQVERGGRFTIRDPLHCRHLTIEGDLKANVSTQGTVTIRTGGVLRGELHGSHLVVEEGGGLRARIEVRPAPPKATHTKAGKQE